MAKARPSNLPTKPNTAEVQRIKAKEAKTRYTQTDRITIRFCKDRIEFERSRTSN